MATSALALDQQIKAQLAYDAALARGASKEAAQDAARKASEDTYSNYIANLGR